MQQCEEIICSPAVISEIRDLATRTHVETTLKPFLVLRTPKPESVRVISDFAKKTGDIAVLSKTDIQLLALAYEIECERNDGDWRLRKVPGQKRINGSAPAAKPKEEIEAIAAETVADVELQEIPETIQKHQEGTTPSSSLPEEEVQKTQVPTTPGSEEVSLTTSAVVSLTASENVSPTADEAHLSESISHIQIDQADEIEDNVVEADGSDSEGWITPSNIKRKQLEEDKADASGTTEPKVMQVVRV